MGLFRDEEGINWAYVVAAFGWAMFVTAIVGEVLGWWDQLGEGMAIAGILLGLLLPFFGAGRQQVTRIGDHLTAELRAVRTDLGGIGGGIRGIDRKLDKLDVLDTHTELLREIRDALRHPPGRA